MSNVQGVVGMVWRRLDDTTKHCLYDKRHERGGGNKQIDIGSTVELHKFLGIPLPPANQEFRFDVQSSDRSMATIAAELNVRGISRRKTWRLKNQNKDGMRPAEWKPGFRLPLASQDVPDGFLLILKKEDGTFHARVLFDEELGQMPEPLGDLMRSSRDNPRSSSGMWS